MPRERYSIGDLVLDPGAASVERRGEPIRLTGLSFDLLVTLARHAPDVVDQETLAREVWELTAVSDETIMQRVALLRRALGDDAAAPRYVRSVRGKGYALVPEVMLLGSPARPRSARRWTAAVALALGLVASAWYLGSRPGESPAAPGAVRTASATADELASRADQFLGRHRKTDNETAISLYERALELSPAHPRALVGLSIAHSQRVTKFNYPAGEAERALELAELRLAIAPDDAGAHYARAFALDSLGRIGPALESYRRAAALDPTHLAAVADASYLHMVRGELAEALEASLGVLAAGGRLHYLEVEIGWSLALLGFESAAAIWLHRALELWPDSPFAGSTFARFRLHQGRLGEAESLAREALDRGVERSELPALLGHVALLRGDRQAALEWYRRADEVTPRIDAGALRLLVLGSGEAGAGERYRELGAALGEGLAEGDEWPGTAIEKMLLHAGFGDFDAALTALDRAIDLGYRESAWLLLDPMLVELRRQPGFMERVERIAVAIERERQEVLSADWLPEDLLEPRLEEEEAPPAGR